MAQLPLAPPPQTGQPIDGWLYLLWKRLTATGQILWSGLSFTGSNLTDIETRNHADLQNLNTTNYTHLTDAEYTDLTDGGSTTLHTHSAGSGLGDFSSNTSSSVDAEIVLFSGTGGKTGKRASMTGLVKAASGVASAASEGVDYGFANIPQNSKSAAYTTVLSDAGKHIFHPSADTTARTWTIDSNANVAYTIGTVITFVNQNGAGVITIAITSDTMRLAGAGTTGSRTLAANGMSSALKVTSTEWIISGTGLT